MRQSLKTYIFVFLFFLLLLVTLLTFLLSSFFWFQEVSRLYVGQKETEIRLLAERYLVDVEQNAKAFSVAVLLHEILEHSEALNACALLENGRIFCPDQGESQANSMRTLLKSATVQRRMVSAMTGVDWLGPLPVHQYLELAVPLSTKHLDTTVVLRYFLTPLYVELEFLLRYIGIYLVLNLLVLLSVGFFRLYRDVLKPIEKLIHSADAYTEKDGVPFLTLTGRDEFGQLGHSIERMLHRIQSDREKLESNLASLEEANRRLLANQKEMVRAEKLSSLGQLAAGLAHEIGNPLGIVQGYLALLREKDLNEDLRSDYLNRAEKELERISHLIRQLLDYSRSTSDDRVIDAHAVLQEAMELLRPQPLFRDITLNAHLIAEEVPIYGNPAQLTQVFLNCLINAADAIHARTKDGRGHIDVTSYLSRKNDEDILCLEIADTGIGLSDNALTNALDPFFTTKEQGRGTGLGLSVSSALLRDMGGDITLANRDEGGALVTVLLPLYNPGEAAGANKS